MNRWLRVVLPGWWMWLIAVLLMRGLCLFGDWMLLDVIGFDPRSSLGKIGLVCLVFSMVAYAIFRVLAAHPACRANYFDWLKNSCWRSPLPLPLGPIHLVPQDLAIVGTLVGLELVVGHWGLESAFSPLRIAQGFLIVYVLILGGISRGLGQMGTTYAAWFVLGLSVRLWELEYLSLLVLVASYAIALWGLRRSLTEFPWESNAALQRQLEAMRHPENRVVNSDSLGWPFGRFLQLREGSITQRESVLLGLLIGWWFAVGVGVVRDGVPRDALFFPALAAFVLPLVRCLIYVPGYAPPISFFGRLFTGRWIIPSYDKVLVAPLLAWLASLLVLGVLVFVFDQPLRSKDWPPLIELVVAAPLPVCLMILFGVGPTLRDWQLTGGHRITRAVSLGTETRIG